jgi:hypothetical protein
VDCRVQFSDCEITLRLETRTKYGLYDHLEMEDRLGQRRGVTERLLWVGVAGGRGYQIRNTSTALM